MKKMALILVFAFAASGCFATGTAIDPRFTTPIGSDDFVAACHDRAELAKTYKRTDAQLQAVKGIATGVVALGLLPIDALGAIVGAEAVADNVVREDINQACRKVGVKQ